MAEVPPVYQQQASVTFGHWDAQDPKTKKLGDQSLSKNKMHLQQNDAAVFLPEHFGMLD